LKNKYKVMVFSFALVLLVGTYVAVHLLKSGKETDDIADKGIYYGVVESSGKNNDNIFESPLRNEKEINISDRNFLSWYNELEASSDKYSGRPFEMTGNIFNIEVDNNTKTLVGRYVLESPLEKKEMKGIIIKTDKSFSNDEWVHIKGTMETETIHGAKVPAVRVEYIEKVQNMGADFLYGY